MKLFELTPETQMHLFRALETLVELEIRDAPNLRIVALADAKQAIAKAKEEILPQLFNS